MLRTTGPTGAVEPTGAVLVEESQRDETLPTTTASDLVKGKGEGKAVGGVAVCG